MIIWELSFAEDITTYILPNKKEEEEFLKFEDEIFDIASSASTLWSPFMIMKKEQKKDVDITELEDIGYTIINEKCKDLILPLFKTGEIEFLEFQTEIDADKFYLLNIIGLIKGVLDQDSVHLLKTSMDINVDIKEINFIEKNINKPIFKIEELPHSVFVTDEFVNIYEENGLTGLIFNDDNIFWRI